MTQRWVIVALVMAFLSGGVIGYMLGGGGGYTYYRPRHWSSQGGFNAMLERGCEPTMVGDVRYVRCPKGFW